MAFGELWGSNQRRVMLELADGPRTVDELAVKISIDRPGRVPRVRETLKSLEPKYVVETDAGWSTTSIGWEIALNMKAALRDLTLCRTTR